MRGIARAALARSTDARALPYPRTPVSPDAFRRTRRRRARERLGPSELVAIQTTDGYRTGVDAFALAARAGAWIASRARVASANRSPISARDRRGRWAMHCSASPGRRHECVFFESKRRARTDALEASSRIALISTPGSSKRIARFGRGEDGETVRRALANPLAEGAGTPTSKSEEKMLGRFESTATIEDFVSLRVRS